MAAQARQKLLAESGQTSQNTEVALACELGSKAWKMSRGHCATVSKTTINKEQMPTRLKLGELAVCI
ncbi:hypothetical protein [Zhongshania sp.]|jgi:hypothetical protein|uniref:hypothetical protein n=1 Tax=Zhongshania sp. TaxID=1971902 RepID=UPI0039E5A22D